MQEEGKRSKYFQLLSHGRVEGVQDEASSKNGEYQGLLFDRVTSNLLSPRHSLPSQATVLPLKPYKTKPDNEDAPLCTGQGG